MSSCDSHITRMRPEKSCSGKCGVGPCGSEVRIWLLAASEGLAALYEKHDSKLVLIKPRNAASAPLMGEVCSMLNEAAVNGRFNQLLLVGSPVDISWMLLSLPEAVTQKVAAEIKYPLLPSWFKQQEEGGKSLHRAIETALCT